MGASERLRAREGVVVALERGEGKNIRVPGKTQKSLR